MDDRTWYVDVRIKEAYQFAENQCLAKAAQGTWSAPIIPTLLLRLASFINRRTLLAD